MGRDRQGGRRHTPRALAVAAASEEGREATVAARAGEEMAVATVGRAHTNVSLRQELHWLIHASRHRWCRDRVQACAGAPALRNHRALMEVGVPTHPRCCSHPTHSSVTVTLGRAPSCCGLSRTSSA